MAIRGAHKNRGGTKVVGQETQEGTKKGRRYESQGDVPAKQSAQKRGGGGEKAYASGETIKSINEVEGVGAADQPNNGQENMPPGTSHGMASDALDHDMGVTREYCGQCLTDQFHPGFEAKDVIQEASGKGHEHRRQQGADRNRCPSNGVRVPQRREADQRKRECVAGENGYAAGAGNGAAVNLAWIWLVHPTDAPAQETTRRSRGQR
jgi:hypothetical protein